MQKYFPNFLLFPIEVLGNTISDGQLDGIFPNILVLLAVYLMLAIQSVMAIFSFYKKMFLSCKRVVFYNVFFIVLIVIGALTILLSPKFSDVAVQLFIGLIVFGSLSVFLPNIQFYLYKKHNKAIKGACGWTR